MREGVGENSKHEIEYVDIQLGSCICLSVCYVGSLHVHLGEEYVRNYHYWALLTLSRDHYFKYR